MYLAGLVFVFLFDLVGFYEGYRVRWVLDGGLFNFCCCAGSGGFGVLCGFVFMLRHECSLCCLYE